MRHKRTSAMKPKKVLVIDVGGTHVKLRAPGRRRLVKFLSGPAMTAAEMVAGVKQATAGWDFDAISIGYPGPVKDNHPQREPHNLGGGWVKCNFQKAFGCPVKIMNDAAMQALGGHTGGRTLFLGLGTGLGSALVVNREVLPLELAHLPYKKNRSYEEFLGTAGLKRLGEHKWRRHVEEVVGLLKNALLADSVVLGGGNARLIKKFPPGVRPGKNSNAMLGGRRLWEES
jgi:polyphosphate glucokinase